MSKICKILRKLLFQRKPPTFKRKNGTSMQFRKSIILVALIAGFLSLVMIMKQYIGVLLQGKGSTHSVILHFNRYGELYWDGVALVGLLSVISIALVLYVKEFKEVMLNE